jgi:hypothetical protein
MQYTVTATSRPQHAKSQDFYTDETGVIRCTYDDCPADVHESEFCNLFEHSPKPFVCAHRTLCVGRGGRRSE